MKKKLLCIVLSLSMLAAFMPSMAFAEELTPVGVSTVAEFFKAISSNNGETIVLEDDIDLRDAYSLIVGDVRGALEAPPILFEEYVIPVSRSLTINLKGHTLKGVDVAGTFIVIPGSTLKLMNGTLTNGYANGYSYDFGEENYQTVSGGAACVLPGADLVLENMTITGNACDVEFGGAAIDLYGNLYVTGKTVIKGNKAGTFESNIYPHSGLYDNGEGYVFAKDLEKGSHIGIDYGLRAAVLPLHPGHGISHTLGQSDEDSIKYFAADNDKFGVAYWISEEGPIVPGNSLQTRGNVLYNLAVGEALEAAFNNAEVELIQKLELGYVTYSKDEDLNKRIREKVLLNNEELLSEMKDNATTPEQVAEYVAQAKKEALTIAAQYTAKRVANNVFEGVVRYGFKKPCQEQIDTLYEYAGSELPGIRSIARNALGKLQSQYALDYYNYLLREHPLDVHEFISEEELKLQGPLTIQEKPFKIRDLRQVVYMISDMSVMNTALQQIAGQQPTELAIFGAARVIRAAASGVARFFDSLFGTKKIEPKFNEL